MLFKKIALYHVLPITIATVITCVLVKKYVPIEATDYTVSQTQINNTRFVDAFHVNNLNNQLAFSIALKKRIPILFGSSELTSNHLDGLATNFFNKNLQSDHFFSIGHAGFQTLAIMSVLAANKPLLPQSKITIILSPSWFEKQYASGTSLKSFFEFCPPNYLYQIYNDPSIDNNTKKHIGNYLYHNYDKISKPDAVIRLMSKHYNDNLKFHQLMNYPFELLDAFELKAQESSNYYLTSQKQIVEQLASAPAKPYYFYHKPVNWDSLNTIAAKEFKLISNNNDVAVENSYYDFWLKNKEKKKLHAVDLKDNTEYHNFLALIQFLKSVNCKPLFVITPLNTKAHQNMEVLEPVINAINNELKTNNLTVLDMFTPNLKNYQDGVLEDIMHPYNIGWYQIDKFILDNYHDGNK